MTAPLRENPYVNTEPSPRVKLALRLYTSGICKTKRESAIAAGLSPQTLYMLTQPGAGSEPVKRLQSDLDHMLNDETVTMSHVLSRVGRRAIGRIAQIMETAKDETALKAAQDLADRSPDTQKTQRIHVDSFSLNGEDAKELAKALLESTNTERQFDHVATDGLVEIKLEAPETPLLPAPEPK